MLVEIIKCLIEFENEGRDYYGNEIGKYPDVSHFEVPADSVYLSCKAQIDLARLKWGCHIAIYFEAAVPLATTKDVYAFYIVGTGQVHDKHPDEFFLDTIRLNEGEHMWHVYARKLL